MGNRDHDKMNKNISSTNTSSSIGKNKDRSDSRVDFGEKIGRSENLNNEPSGRLGSQGSSGMKGSSGSSRSGSSSDVSSQSGSSSKVSGGQKVSGDSGRGGNRQ